MVTSMEVYALEEGDIIVYLGNYYKFIDTSEEVDGRTRVLVQDEEGYLKGITVPDEFARFWILEESVDA